MDDIDSSLEEFDEYLDGHFGETALPKGSERWRDDALTGNEVNGHKVNERQRAALQGRKLIVHNRAAGSEETLICRGGKWQLDGHGHPVIPPPANPCPISDYAKANPVKSNLRVRSPRLPNLDAEEEASLVLAAQGGDRQAAKKLLDHFHGWIRHAAWKPWLRHQPKNFKMDVISNPRKERGRPSMIMSAPAFSPSAKRYPPGNLDATDFSPMPLRMYMAQSLTFHGLARRLALRTKAT
jgi:hypothetical protein